ncbi:MAG: cupin domain-containing protein [Anaerolineales bacterium]|nr:cupin domain-containing protein [Anaerolineales bacterium]
MSEINIGNKIRQLREQAGLSLRALADLGGLSFNAISRIERGENSPTVATLHRLATALEVPITEFFRDASEQQQTIFTKAGNSFRTHGDGIQVENLGSGLPYQQLEVFRLTMEPGSHTTPTPITHAGEELIYCFSGQVEYAVDGRSYDMQPGDTLLFKADQPHACRNASGKTAVILLVLHAGIQTPPLWQQHLA